MIRKNQVLLYPEIIQVAAEQAAYGVRANVVGPGPIDTAWTHKAALPMEEKMEKTNNQANVPGHRGTPEVVDHVSLFLASDEASYVTDALYMVDGGITIAKGDLEARQMKPWKEHQKGILI